MNIEYIPSISTDLGEEQVNTEGSVLVVEEALELGDLLLEHLGGVADTADNTETASVGDGSGELGAGSDVHASKNDGVVDLEELGELSGDSYRIVSISSGFSMSRMRAREAATRTRWWEEQTYVQAS